MPTRPETDVESVVLDVMHANGATAEADEVMAHVLDILRGTDDPHPAQVEQAVEEALRGL